MFGKRQTKNESCNPFISRMTGYMNDAIEGGYRTPCAEEIVPMIKALFEKSINAKVKWDGNVIKLRKNSK